MTKIVYPKVTILDVFKAFWSGVRLRKWRLFLIVITIATANVCATIAPLLYKRIFDIIYVGGNHADITAKLYGVVIFLALLYFAWWSLLRISEFTNNFFQPATMATLKQQSYDHLIEHSYGFFTNNFVGSLVQKVNRFGRAFEVLTDNLVWKLIPLLVRFFSIIIILFFINHWIAAIVGIWVLIFLSFNITFSRWKLKYDVRGAAMDSRSTAYLADTIANQNTVALFSASAREKVGYKKVTSEQFMLQRFRWNLDGTMNAVQAALSFSIEIVLFYYAIRYWDLGLVTVSVFALLQVYAGSLIDQLWDFSRIVRSSYEAYADAKEMVEIMKLPHEIQDVPKAKDLKVGKGEIAFSNLQFGFNETRTVLENINVVIKPGEKVALIGPSGAGKTTFVRLLLRLYSPTAGVISIDGQDIAKATQNSLRKNISLVPQDPVLFHRTLAENIAYGKPGASRKEIEKAAKLAHCDEFIITLPLGLETLVGERGIKLSGGERQRVAIARAILKNAPILVLDEATSSLDSHSEMLIQDALATLMEGKTVIVIAHRLSTIQKMDRIMVIDNGKIIEEGSHAELLQNENSLYKKLWTLQAGGFIAEDNSDTIEE